jgi:hypothetical protein
VVRFDRPLLGDISGLRGVHLQCHIGTDTISLARLGATMTGLDFSPAALAEARTLAGRTGAGVATIRDKTPLFTRTVTIYQDKTDEEMTRSREKKRFRPSCVLKSQSDHGKRLRQRVAPGHQDRTALTTG